MASSNQQKQKEIMESSNQHLKQFASSPTSTTSTNEILDIPDVLVLKHHIQPCRTRDKFNQQIDQVLLNLNVDEQDDILERLINIVDKDRLIKIQRLTRKMPRTDFNRLLNQVFDIDVVEAGSLAFPPPQKASATTKCFFCMKPLANRFATCECQRFRRR